MNRILTALLSGCCLILSGPGPGSADSFATGDWAESPEVREPGTPVEIPNLALDSLDARVTRLNDLFPAPAVVLAMTSTSCPVSKRYAPTLAALEKRFTKDDVRFVFVHPVATDGPDAIREAAGLHGFQGPLVRDIGALVQTALQAESTSEVFVLDSRRRLVYRGAVDDQYGLGYSREAASATYLLDALEAVLQNSTPAVSRTSAPGCALDPRESSDAPLSVGQLTYHGSIERILDKHCVECHRSGGVAPFALQTYDQVVAHAGMIRKQVRRGAMPPWFAAPELGDAGPWANDRSLPPRDREVLLSWLDGDRPVGDPSLAPPPRAFPEEWRIGTPDAVVTIPEAVNVPATGTLPYHNVTVETRLGGDRWVQAMEVLPSARDVVHHVLVFVVPPDQATGRRRRSGDRGNFFAVYVPGNSVLSYPEGFAKSIPDGARLHFQIHYTPTGTPVIDRTRLGLVFAEGPPEHEVRVAAIAGPINIPPGAPDYETRGTLPVPFHARLLAFMPHMHVRGKAFRYEYVTPDGGSGVLLDVPRYDFNWQLRYELQEPFDLPAGSRLIGTARYDNSPGNPANPDPARRVRWGEQTDDEMMLGYLEYYLPDVPPSHETRSVTELIVRDGSAVFAGLDRNRDGVLSPSESPDRGAFQRADADADGEVTRDEFARFWRNRNPGRN